MGGGGREGEGGRCVMLVVARPQSYHFLHIVLFLFLQKDVVMMGVVAVDTIKPCTAKQSSNISPRWLLAVSLVTIIRNAPHISLFQRKK